jgi:hypothetical protein
MTSHHFEALDLSPRCLATMARIDTMVALHLSADRILRTVKVAKGVTPNERTVLTDYAADACSKRASGAFGFVS